MPIFTQDEYDVLWAWAYQPRVQLNFELPDGRIIRKQTRPARIDCRAPGYEELKRQIKQHVKEKAYSAIHNLLSRLKDHETYPLVCLHPGIILDDDVIITADPREKKIVNADEENDANYDDSPAIVTSTAGPADPYLVVQLEVHLFSKERQSGNLTYSLCRHHFRSFHRLLGRASLKRR